MEEAATNPRQEKWGLKAPLLVFQKSQYPTTQYLMIESPMIKCSKAASDLLNGLKSLKTLAAVRLLNASPSAVTGMDKNKKGGRLARLH